MTDDELRAVLRNAHDDDRPPPFTVGKRRLPMWPSVALVAAAAAVVLFLFFKKPAVYTEAIGMNQTSLRLPTDGLLDLPGARFLSTTPRLDQGVLP